MKRQKLLRNPPSATICAFCVHHFENFRPIALHGRLLHSTRRVSNPPAEATASSNANEGYHNRPPTPFELKHGSSTAIPNGGIPLRSQASIANIELPHERRLREMMAKTRNPSASTKVVRETGSSQPTASRYDWKAKDQESREQAITKARTSYRSSGRSTNNDARSFKPQSNHDVLGDGFDSYSFTPSVPPDANGHRWPQLRRQGSGHRASASSPPAPDPYLAARNKREEEARKGAYTSVASRATSNARSYNDRSRVLDRSAESQHHRPSSQSISSNLWTSGGRRSDWDTSQSIRTSGLGQDAAQRPDHQASNQSSFTKDAVWNGVLKRSISRPPESKLESSYRLDLGQQEQARGPDATTTFRPLLAPQRARELETPKAPRASDAKMEQSSETQGTVSMPRADKDDKRKRKTRFASPDDENAEISSRERTKVKRKGGRRESDNIEGDDEQDIESIELKFMLRAERKKQKKQEKLAMKANTLPKILLPEYISVANLAVALKARVENFQTKLAELGFEGLSNDHILNAETSGLIAMEYNFEPIIDQGESLDLRARPPSENVSDLSPRPPVVTIMGHVDHGKTTILDWLRKSSVAASEHGGITQHIGAFSVTMPSGKIITFLDTPGHAAFLDMRQRGANVTDIVILVVAADDGVKPQTIEAIKHAKSAKVPVIVAINKVDKEETDIERVKQDLARHEVDIEDYGGDTQVVCISGKTGKGMEDLENAAITLSEILDMRAEVIGPVEGWVLEASIKDLGKVATILVRRGTLRPGDCIVAGKTWARVRSMRNEAGLEVEQAGPGTPVEIDGWRSQPEAGDEVLEASDESKAKSVVEYRLEAEERDKMAVDMEAINTTRSAIREHRQREKDRLEADSRAAEDSILDAVESMSISQNPESAKDSGSFAQTLPLIVKADVSGSLEAVVNSIVSVGNSEVRPLIVRTGVGQVSEFDVSHAAAAKGFIINFNTQVESHIQRMADEAKVRIMDHNIIYRLGDDIKKALEDLLPPSVTYRVLGEVEIMQIFQITIKGRKERPVAGCKVKNGVLGRKSRVRVLRSGRKVFDGTLSSLKNGKKDIDDAKRGSECGMAFEEWDAFVVGDQVQAYEEIKEKRYL